MVWDDESTCRNKAGYKEVIKQVSTFSDMLSRMSNIEELGARETKETCRKQNGK